MDRQLTEGFPSAGLAGDALEEAFKSAPTHTYEACEEFEAALGRHLVSRYAIDGTLTRLGSERDETFLLSVNSSQDVIVKVCAADEARVTVEMQIAVAGHLSRTTKIPIPTTARDLSGNTISRWRRPEGQPDRMVYVIRCMPGRSLASQELTASDARRVGAVHAELTTALTGFRHPAAHRRLVWDLSSLPALSRSIPAVGPDAAVMTQVVNHFDRFVVPAAEDGARQVVHGDFSVHNVLVDPIAPGFVTGVIDFGDVHVGSVLYDLAIAVSNLLDHQLDDPWVKAANHVRGYLSMLRLPDRQLEALGAAAAARCVQRALVSEWRAYIDSSRANYVLEHSRHDWANAEVAMHTLDKASEHFSSTV